ncbi:MAG TPA: hypothetical protein PLP73_00600 [Candidatus Absconditabacterales bacterium]|nr:hypothetical protein [Candidatus Absconditabacterales bacterium]
MFTPDNIDNLKENEVFVFGSNGNGLHFGGAAKVALEKFGAIQGQSEGIQGQSYGINTMDGKDVIKEQLERLVKIARENKDKIFYLTRIGCGIAGYTDQEIIELLPSDLPTNIILPKGWATL